ncbi:glycosyltransferase family 2 protein [Rhodohalobacter sp. 8-1]|uniref:glycosyltransferase family 2 protein n=1 Tax=Rhodohalobacter sp. 8-1 TaxID=3131972 RepID=UPI0030EF2D31
MKISVVIPCYNEEQYIGQAIGSIMEQTRPADEIIVVDDGSDDRSTEIAGSFGKGVTILSSGGGGAPLARNMGAEYASGDALMFFDADDVLGPHAMEALTEQLEMNPDGIAACQWFRLEKINGLWVKRPRSCSPLSSEKDYLDGWIGEIYHPPCSVLWSRAAYERTGGWDQEVRVNQDGDLMMRALADGTDLQITQKGAAYYRRMPEEQLGASQSAGRFKRTGRESQIYVILKVIKKLEEREMLDDYRHSLTVELNKIYMHCKDLYPDLAKECRRVIRIYGEPGYIHSAKGIKKGFRSAVRAGSNRVAGLLNKIGLIVLREWLSRIKNKMFSRETASSHEDSSDSTTPAIGEEIRYGLEACQKAIGKEQ